MADNSKKKENKNNKAKKSFFKDVKAELKKVTWPTKKQVVNNTVGVIIIVIITAIIVFALDFTFKNFNEYVVNGIRTKVSEFKESNTVSNETLLNTVVSEETDAGNSVLENTVQ